MRGTFNQNLPAYQRELHATQWMRHRYRFPSSFPLRGGLNEASFTTVSKNIAAYFAPDKNVAVSLKGRAKGKSHLVRQKMKRKTQLATLPDNWNGEREMG